MSDILYTPSITGKPGILPVPDIPGIPCKPGILPVPGFLVILPVSDILDIPGIPGIPGILLGYTWLYLVILGLCTLREPHAWPCKAAHGLMLAKNI